MRTITYYECEICGRRYTLPASAEKCEARGLPDVSKFPRGLIHGNASDDAMYRGITFIVEEAQVARDNPHFVDASLWAFRDNYAGDSRGLDDTCGSSNYFLLTKADVPDRKHPTFKRAVAFLKKHNITPTVWDGTKPVKL